MQFLTDFLWHLIWCVFSGQYSLQVAFRQGPYVVSVVYIQTLVSHYFLRRIFSDNQEMRIALQLVVPHLCGPKAQQHTSHGLASLRKRTGYRYPAPKKGTGHLWRGVEIIKKG
jgi:hypothetical protein